MKNDKVILEVDHLKKHFEQLGYTVTEAGNIPGFWTDVDTGRPGPTVLVMGELDALVCGDIGCSKYWS